MDYVILRSSDLLDFHVLTILDLVDGKSNAFGVALGVKLDLTDGSINVLGTESFGNLGVVGAAGILDCIQQSQS